MDSHYNDRPNFFQLLIFIAKLGTVYNIEIELSSIGLNIKKYIFHIRKTIKL